MIGQWARGKYDYVLRLKCVKVGASLYLDFGRLRRIERKGNIRIVYNVDLPLVSIVGLC